MTGKNLLLFNLKTDADDDVLGFTTDWINALAVHFERVFVITMFAGRIAVADNVQVFSVGREKGYSKTRRIFEFYRLLFGLLHRERIDACFAHMIQLFAVLSWPLLRPKRIPIVLWFGHKATPMLLKVAHLLVDRVVTSTPAAFSLKSDKVAVIGQGITETKFPLRPPSPRNNPFVLISVARLSQIKHIDIMIEAVATIVRRHGKDSIRLILLGEALSDSDKAYKSSLQSLVTELHMRDNVQFIGAVPHAEVATWLRQADMSLNFAPKGAIDKAALESLASGIPVLVQNESFLAVFDRAGVAPDLFLVKNIEADTVAQLIEHWMQFEAHESRAILEQLSVSVLTEHGLSRLAKKITAQFQLLMR